MTDHRWQHVAPHPRGRVFAWHARPMAWRRLTAPWMVLQPRHDASDLRSGAAVLAPPVGPAWVAQHEPGDYVEGESFADVCMSQPYAALTRWRHRHLFEDAPGGTRVADHVTTRVPRRLLDAVFVYRHRQLDAELAALDRAAVWRDGPATVAVTGASGLVGSQLVALLSGAGHRVVRLERPPSDGVPEGGDLSRGGSGADGDVRRWDPQRPAADLLTGCTHVVHLAGAPIAGRFTEAHRRAVRDSRLGPTRALAAVAAATPGMEAFVSASAVGVYGPDRGDEPLTEDSSRGRGFLADVVDGWEDACAPALEGGLRVAMIRTGLVLSGRGGLLGALRHLYGAGLGGRLGSGEQWMSWIALDDLLDVYHRAVVDRTVAGAVNAVAPEPARNDDFTQVLARVLRRPAVMTVPAAVPRAALGEIGGDELVLADQRVVPAELARREHVFRLPDLEDTLRHELGRPQE